MFGLTVIAAVHKTVKMAIHTLMLDSLTSADFIFSRFAPWP